MNHSFHFPDRFFNSCSGWRDSGLKIFPVFLSLLLLLAGISGTHAQIRFEGPSKGYLVISGGNIHQPTLRKFIQLSGKADPRIIVIPTADSDKNLNEAYFLQIRNYFKTAGAAQIQFLHTRDTLMANSDSFVKVIREADAVWFTGGRQWRLADAFLHTRTLEELHHLLERGGVIGGSSAGASIMGSFLVRGDSKTNQIMEGDHRLGFNFLKNCAIDQHILQRNRHFDLAEIHLRYPELLCIGLDANTTLIVHQNEMEVMGEHYVSIFDGTFWDPDTGEISKLPGNSERFYFLRAGDKYDLSLRRVILKKR